MPKESFTLKRFGGMSPSSGGDISPLLVKNMRLDMPDTVAYPENTNTVEETGLESVIPYIAKKTMYVDGVYRTISVRKDGYIYVDNSIVGSIPETGDVSISVIGRQAIVTASGIMSKIVRVGYPGKKHIGFGLDEIIVEGDQITPSTAVFGRIKQFIPINEENILLLLEGSSSISMLYMVSPGVWRVKDTKNLCEEPIVDIACSISTDTIGAATYAKVNNLYYMRTHVIGNPLLSRVSISSLYDGGHTSDPSGLDIDAFGVIDGTRQTVTVSITSQNIPNGFTASRIAVTANKVFISFSCKSGGSYIGAGALDGNITLNEDEDLLFSLGGSTFDDGANVTVSTSSSTLAQSMLPWNPYKKEVFRASLGYGNGRIRFAEGTEWGLPLYGNIYIPQEVTHMLGDSDTAGNNMAIYWLAMKAAENSVTASNYDGYVSMPGNCGAKADTVLFTGELIVIDYAEDVVGYMVKIIGDEAGFPISQTNPFPSSTAHENGCGLIKTKRYASSYQIDRPSYLVIADSTHATEPGLFTELSNAYCFYCWNGVSPTSTYDIDTWVLPTTPSTYNRVNLSRVFDVDAMYSGGTNTQCRFVVIPSIKVTECENAGSSQFVLTDTTTFGSIALLGTTPPILLAGKLSDADYTDIGVGEILAWEDESVELGGMHRVTTNNANILVSSTLADLDVKLATIDANYDPTSPSTISDVTIGDPTVLGVPASFITPVAVNANDEPAISKDVITRYKVAFMLDGITTTPLSSYSVDIDSSEAGLDTDDEWYYVDIDIKFKLSWLTYISKRVTSICVYAAEVVADKEVTLYRLVKSIPVTAENFSYSATTEKYKGEISDHGERGAAFNQIAGYSETTQSISIVSGCECVAFNYLFAGNVKVDTTWEGSINTSNLVVRSLPFQPSAFNYSEDFTVLTFTPIALVPFNGRVYAFGRDKYSIINPDTLSVEFTSEECGIASRNHVVQTEKGIFAFYNNNIYAISGQSCISVGDDIKVANGDYPGLTSLMADHLFVGYVQSRDMVLVVGHWDYELYMFGFNISSKRWGVFSIGVDGSDYEQYPVAMYQEEDKYCVIVYGEYQEGGLGYMTYSLFDGSDSMDMVLEYLMSFGDEDTEKIIYAASVVKNTTAVSSGVYINNIPRLPVKTKTAIVKVESSDPITAISFIVRRLVLTD